MLVKNNLMYHVTKIGAHVFLRSFLKEEGVDSAMKLLMKTKDADYGEYGNSNIRTQAALRFACSNMLAYMFVPYGFVITVVSLFATIPLDPHIGWILQIIAFSLMGVGMVEAMRTIPAKADLNIEPGATFSKSAIPRNYDLLIGFCISSPAWIYWYFAFIK